MFMKIIKTMDANEACASTSYMFTELAGIYPITPSSPMAEHMDEWSSNNRLNIFNDEFLNYLKINYYVDGFLNKNAIGLIAGQLDRSGNYCLITASQKEGRTYIFVVMCASGMVVERDEENRTTYYFVDGNAYVDMNKLIDWTRNSFTLVTVATQDTIVGELRVNVGSNSHVMVVPCEKVEKLVLDIEVYQIETNL